MNDSVGERSGGTNLTLGRKDNVIVGTHDRAGELAEDDGLLGDGNVLFIAMVHVIHAHTHHLIWPGDWGQEGHL